jgi:hypothetical protein
MQSTAPVIKHRANTNGLGISLGGPQVQELRSQIPTTAHIQQPGCLQVSDCGIANTTVPRSKTKFMEFSQGQKDRSLDAFTSADRQFRIGMVTNSQSSTIPVKQRAWIPVDGPPPLGRQPTLFTKNGTQQRSVAELKNVLGSLPSGKLDSKARVLPSHNFKSTRNGTSVSIPSSPVVYLEQAKTSSRVELDLILDSDTCIEGGYMRGSVVIRIRPSKKEKPIYVGDGKVRIVGFESMLSISELIIIPTGVSLAIRHQDQRYIFYHCGSPLSNISPFVHQVYNSPGDQEGFCLGKEGEHLLPFAMRLPPRQKNLPVAKGVYRSV